MTADEFDKLTSLLLNNIKVDCSNCYTAKTMMIGNHWHRTYWDEEKECIVIEEVDISHNSLK